MRVHQAILERHDLPQTLAQVVRAKQFADPHRVPPADFILVTRPDAAARRAELGVGIRFGESLFFHVVRENHVRVVADHEVRTDGDADRTQLVHFFDESRRVNDDAVTDHRLHVRLQHAGRQQRKGELAVAPNDGVPRVGSAIESHDEIVLIAEQIDDFPLGFVAPLEANDTGAGHECSANSLQKKTVAGPDTPPKNRRPTAIDRQGDAESAGRNTGIC